MIPETTWNPIFKNLAHLKGTTTGSECQTEGIIKAIFEICKPQNKWCVEVGAMDGMQGSNTLRMIEAGWSSLQIEGDRNQANDAGRYFDLVKNHQDHSYVICHNAFIKPDHFGFPDEFSQILKSWVPENFDFLSLDIDSYDYEVWKAMSFSPNVIVIECNSEEEDFDVVDYDPSFSVKECRFDGYNPIRYGGATVGLLNRLADYKEYDLVCVDKHDAVYIRRGFSDPLLKV